MLDKPHSSGQFTLAKFKPRALLSVAALLIMTACASPEMTQNAEAKTKNTAAEPSSSSPDFPVRPFPEDTFYDLLVAEVAGTRGDLDLALENYHRQAFITRDPGVIARAVSTASYQKNNDALQELGILWAEVEPESLQARNMAFYAQAQRGNFNLAFDHAEFLLRQNATTDGLTFSINPNGQDIILSLLIYDRYLNVDIGIRLFEHLFERADYYDNVLVEEYGAYWKEVLKE